MEFTLKHEFNCSKDLLFKAWLNSEQHSEMTGGEANITDKEGENFSAWDEYISGENLILIPNSYIKQSWRTSQFSYNQEDSIIELFFEEIKVGISQLTLKHSNLTDSDSDNGYKKGWLDHYFKPMSQYFGQKSLIH